MAATFADYFTLKLGEVTVKGRRLTLREIRQMHVMQENGDLSIEESVKLVKSRVTLEGGGEFDPEDLTPNQMRQLIGELVLPEEGRGISDFIGLLSPTGA